MKKNYLKNIIFGAEDSLVSTVGVMFGVASASNNAETILFTGLVVIAVEALSMGAGAYLSENSAKEVHKNSEDEPLKDGFIMFFSYFFAGFIPLLPYLLLPLGMAKLVSIIVTMITLFVIGYIPTKKFGEGVRMAVVAGLAVLVGFLIGSFFNGISI